MWRKPSFSVPTRRQPSTGSPSYATSHDATALRPTFGIGPDVDVVAIEVGEEETQAA